MKNRNITILKSASDHSAIVSALAVVQIDEYQIRKKGPHNYCVSFDCDDETLFSLGSFFEHQKKENKTKIK